MLWIAAAALVLLGALALAYLRRFVTPTDKTGMVYEDPGRSPEEQDENENPSE